LGKFLTEKETKVLEDSTKANIRKVAGVKVQTIPKKWLDRKDLRKFFNNPNLEVRLVKVNGQPHIEIGIEREEEE